jgi:hypothetical protein
MIRFIRSIPRNAALLVFLLLMIIVSPAVAERGSGYLFELVFDLILLSGVYSVGPIKHRWPFSVLTAVTLALRWGEHLSGAFALDAGALLMTVVWVAYAVSIIIGHLFQRRDVTIDTILGSVVVYLLVAVAFTMLFEVVEITSPGSFSGVPAHAEAHRGELGTAMMYFSLVCITTMGYGDIVPVSSIARPLAVLEGAFGQLYLAVMIARLVGLHIARDNAQQD